MYVDLTYFHWTHLFVPLILLFVLLAALGAGVTRANMSTPVLLTPERWTSTRLARQARAETEVLRADARRLRQLLQSRRPDPVAAMLLAQQIYARHRQGVSATAGARIALIAAAEAHARYAMGDLSRTDAIRSFNAANARIASLHFSQEDISPPDHFSQYLPSQLFQGSLP